jgi:DNA-binding NtrC family response regulator
VDRVPETRPVHLLVVDDDAGQCEMLARILRLEGYSVATASTAAEALAEARRRRPDAVLSDHEMPGRSGIELHSDLKAEGQTPVFILVTAYGTLDVAIAALRAGITDFVTKPLDLPLLRIRLEGALRLRELESENSALRRTLDTLASDTAIVGSSPAMERVLRLIEQVASSQATVLLLGESGTGKELVARALHGRGPRRLGPFVALNCAAIPESLMEDELFGHVRGAFTGAASDRRGRFELAHGGTLLLDEVGDLPLHLQPKLLRVLQERTVEPVGGGTARAVDVRLVAATNQDLRRLVDAGRFREDLFYRLSVIPIHLPPLRERGEDVIELAEHFRARFARENGRRLHGFDAAASDALRRHPWPGNVRELENCVERAVILAAGPDIRAADLGLAPATGPSGDVVHAAVEAIFQGRFGLDGLEAAVIQAALGRCGGNLSRAARTLGLTRRTLQYRVEKLRQEAGLRGPEERS